MVEEKNSILDDDLLLETLEDLPRISVPGLMLPNIMNQVVDEHIRAQFRSLLLPVYLSGLCVLFGAVSTVSPSDLSWAELLNQVFSSPDSGLLVYFHQIAHISFQMIAHDPLFDSFLAGLPIFALILLMAVLVFWGVRFWVRWLHKSSQERASK